VDEINAQGGILLGGERRKVNVVYYDDKYQGSDALDVANRLINQDKSTSSWTDGLRADVGRPGSNRQG